MPVPHLARPLPRILLHGHAAHGGGPTTGPCKIWAPTRPRRGPDRPCPDRARGSGCALLRAASSSPCDRQRGALAACRAVARAGGRRAGSLRGPAGPALAARTGPPSRLDRRAGGRPLPLTKKRPLPLTKKRPLPLKQKPGVEATGSGGSRAARRSGGSSCRLWSGRRGPRVARPPPGGACRAAARAGWWWGGPARAPRGRRLGPTPNGTARSSRTSSAPIRLGNSAPFPTSPWPGFYATRLPAELCVQGGDRPVPRWGGNLAILSEEGGRSFAPATRSSLGPGVFSCRTGLLPACAPG